MRTNMAPIYATLKLAYFVENLYEILRKKYTNNIKTEFIRRWTRCWDDCFIFWKYSWGSIINLHNLLQNLHPKIKSPIKHNFKDITFLDNLIKNQNGQIILDVYHKPQIPNNITIWEAQKQLKFRLLNPSR